MTVLESIINMVSLHEMVGGSPQEDIPDLWI